MMWFMSLVSVTLNTSSTRNKDLAKKTIAFDFMCLQYSRTALRITSSHA